MQMKRSMASRPRRANGEAVVAHPNTAWRLVLHEGGSEAPDKPHNNHYGVRVARPEEIEAAYRHIDANKERYGIKLDAPPGWSILRQSSYPSLLAVMAHPDDAEFGAGGTIGKLVKQGADVTYLVVTNGSMGSSDRARWATASAT